MTNETITQLTNSALMQVDIVRLEGTTSLREAVRAMTSARARHAVIEDHGMLIGLVSDRDLRLALPSRLTSGTFGELLDDWTVTEVAIRRPFFVRPEGLATISAQVMIEKGVGCLPVMSNGRVIGLLTLADFARVFAGLHRHYPRAAA